MCCYINLEETRYIIVNLKFYYNRYLTGYIGFPASTIDRAVLILIPRVIICHRYLRLYEPLVDHNWIFLKCVVCVRLSSTGHFRISPTNFQEPASLWASEPPPRELRLITISTSGSTNITPTSNQITLQMMPRCATGHLWASIDATHLHNNS